MAYATPKSVARKPVTLSTEDGLRADLYRLLASCLSASPDAGRLTAISSLSGDDSVLGQAVTALARAAAVRPADQVAQEYQDLFIGLGRGELVPYASYYLTGFLHEKPLAKLREDMAVLGIERVPDVAEPEDHAASILDMMAGLIAGSFGPAVAIDEQQAFYQRHIGCWMGHFFTDLERSKAGVVYASLGTVGRAFLDVEEAAFRMN